MGLGAAIGDLEVEDEGSETYQQVLLRAQYRATEKMSVVCAGGVEFRQGRDDDDEVTPVFSLGLRYAPAEGTVVTLEASRRIENSALEAGRDYLLTGVTAGVRHFLWRGIYLTLDAGYHHADYTEPVAGGAREDSYFFVRPGVLYNFASWASAQIVYLHRENDSTRDSFSFANNQVEIQVSFTF